MLTPGSRTSELWLTVGWAIGCAASTASLLALALADWKAALVAAPVVGVWTYFGGIVVNNYSENRFRLKFPERDKAAPLPQRHIGFARQEEGNESGDQGG